MSKQTKTKPRAKHVADSLVVVQQYLINVHPLSGASWSEIVSRVRPIFKALAKKNSYLTDAAIMRTLEHHFESHGIVNKHGYFYCIAKGKDVLKTPVYRKKVSGPRKLYIRQSLDLIVEHLKTGPRTYGELQCIINHLAPSKTPWKNLLNPVYVHFKKYGIVKNENGMYELA